MILIIPTLIYSRVLSGNSRIGWTAVLDTNDFIRSAAQIDDTFDDMASASSRFDKVMSGVGVGIGVGIAGAAQQMGASIIGAIGDSIEMAKQFEQQMAKVRTLIQVTDTEFDNLGKGVLAISQRLPQTVDSLTAALFNLISAGVETKDSLDVLELSAKAATAGFTDVNTTASLGISTINAYGLEITDLNRVYDIFFETARIGVTDFESLASELGSVLPSAKALGVSLEELGGIFAAATKGGISTAEVVTGLDGTFQDLVSRQAELEELANVKLFDEGNFRGLVPIFNDLSETLGELSAQGRTDLLDKIGFGRESGRIIKTITNDMDTFNESVMEVTNSSGAMERAFDTAISTSENQLGILGNRISTLSLNVLQPFVGLLGDAAGGINRLFDGFDASRITAEFQSLQTSTEGQIQQLETLRGRYKDVTSILKTTTAGTDENTRASVQQKEIIEEIQQILPGAVTGYNEYGEAIGVSVGHINDFIDAQKQMLSTEFVDRIQDLAKNAKTLETQMADLTESASGFAGVSRALDSLGREGFIELVKNAELGEEGLNRLFETFETLSQNRLVPFGLVSEVEGILRTFDNVDDQAKAAGESFDRLGETARAALVDPNERIREMNKQLGITKFALDNLTSSFGLRDLIEDYRKLSEETELTADETKRLQDIIGQGLALQLGANISDVEKQLRQFAEILGPPETPEIIDLPKTIEIPVAIDPLQFDKVKAELKTELDELKLQMIEAGDSQEEFEVARAQRSVEQFTAALTQKVDNEKKFNDALLGAKIELAEAEIKLLEHTQSERERIEDETTRNQEEAAQARVKIFADEISAQLKLLDGLSGQDKTVAIRVLSEVGGFSKESIERGLSGIEDGVLSAADVLELRTNVIQESMNALDQNLDQQTKDTSAFTEFVITKLKQLADTRKRLQSERIKEAQEAADKELEFEVDIFQRSTQIDDDIRQKAQEGRAAEEQANATQKEKGLTALSELAKAEEDNAFQRANFLIDTNQISLEDYRAFLSARRDFLEESGRAETEEWRNVARQLHSVDANISADAISAAHDMEIAFVSAAEKTAKQVSDAFRVAFGEQLPQVLEVAIKNIVNEFKTLDDFMLSFGSKVDIVKRGLQAAFAEDPIAALSLGLTIANGLMDIFGGKTRAATSELDEMRKRVQEAADAIRNELSSAISDSFTEGVEDIDFDALVNAIVRTRLAGAVADVIIAKTGLDKGLADLEGAEVAFRDPIDVLEGGRVRGADARQRAAERQQDAFLKLNRGLEQAGQAIDILPQTIAEISTRLPQTARQFLNSLEDARGEVDRLTPRTGFSAVTEPQGNAILSTLALQTRHLSSIRESGLELVAILNRQPTNGNVIPAVQPIAPPTPIQRFEFNERINIHIDGEVAMQANDIDDVDVEFIADRLRDRVVRRREAIIGRNGR